MAFPADYTTLTLNLTLIQMSLFLDLLPLLSICFEDDEGCYLGVDEEHFVTQMGPALHPALTSTSSSASASAVMHNQLKTDANNCS